MHYSIDATDEVAFLEWLTGDEDDLGLYEDDEFWDDEDEDDFEDDDEDDDDFEDDDEFWDIDL
jgi:hypothetical protein